jgi:hypothetical protein
MNSPFGNSEVAEVLWEKFQELPKNHRQYTTLVYQEFCKVCNELYKNKIFQREVLIHLYYNSCIGKVRRYLLVPQYTYFCNAMQAHLKELKRLDKMEK